MCYIAKEHYSCGCVEYRPELCPDGCANPGSYEISYNLPCGLPLCPSRDSDATHDGQQEPPSGVTDHLGGISLEDPLPLIPRRSDWPHYGQPVHPVADSAFSPRGNRDVVMCAMPPSEMLRVRKLKMPSEATDYGRPDGGENPLPPDSNLPGWPPEDLPLVTLSDSDSPPKGQQEPPSAPRKRGRPRGRGRGRGTTSGHPSTPRQSDRLHDGQQVAQSRAKYSDWRGGVETPPPKYQSEPRGSPEPRRSERLREKPQRRWGAEEH